MRLRDSLVFSLLAAAALAAPASAAVPVDADGALRPRDGAELLEAVDLVTNPADPMAGRIILGEARYEIDRPLVLTGDTGDTLLGAGTARSVITGAGAATTLLELSGESNLVAAMSFIGRGASSAAFPVVRLTGDAQLEEAEVVVSEGLTGASAVEMRGTGNRLAGSEIASENRAPALRIAAGSMVEQTSVYGGDPTVDLLAPTAVPAPGAERPTTVVRSSFLTGGPQTTTVLRAGTTASPAGAALRSTLVNGTASDADLVLVHGATGPTGSLAVALEHPTLLGTPASTALTVRPGSELAATTITASGLLSVGSSTAVTCRAGGAGAPSAVTIDGSYRDGDLQPSSACTLGETGRRTGSPRFAGPEFGDLRPQWGSSLIDGTRETPGHFGDLFGLPRTSAGEPPSATPNDIGALEYQYTPPGFETITAEPVDNRGLVELSVVTFDENPDETEQVTVRWRLPDGTTSSEPTVRWRFDDTTPAPVEVQATDVSGMVRSETAQPEPLIDLTEEPANLDGSPLDASGPLPDDAAPPPTPTPGPLVLISERVDPPPRRAEPVVVAPAPDRPLPALRGIVVLQPQASKTSTRTSGSGPARRGEGKVQVALRQPATLAVSVRRKTGGRFVAVRGGAFGVVAPAGTSSLRLTARLGTAKLRAGLYRVTLVVQPIGGAPETRTFGLRVTR